MADSSDRPTILRELLISLAALSSFLMACRVYARYFLLRIPGADDALAVMAWVFLLGFTVCDFTGTFFGAGQRGDAVSAASRRTLMKIIPSGLLLYFVASGLIRLSIAAFLPRLNRERKFLLFVYALSSAIALVTVGSFLAYCFQCRPVVALWINKHAGKCMTMKHEAALFNVHAASGILFDVMLLLAPIWVLHQNMMFSLRFVRIAFVFAVGIFAIVAGVVRFAYIVTKNDSGKKDMTHLVFRGSIWTNLEAHCGLWVACAPALQSLLRQIPSPVPVVVPPDKSRRRESRYLRSRSRSAAQNNDHAASRFDQRCVAASSSTTLSSFLAGWWRRGRRGEGAAASDLSRSSRTQVGSMLVDEGERVGGGEARESRRASRWYVTAPTTLQGREYDVDERRGGNGEEEFEMEILRASPVKNMERGDGGIVRTIVLSQESGSRPGSFEDGDGDDAGRERDTR